MTSAAKQQLPVVTGLTLGEERRPDPSRPCLILRRVGSESLWQVAKEAHSTTTAIREANGLQNEPAPGQLLLIPVLSIDKRRTGREPVRRLTVWSHCFGGVLSQ